MSDAVSSSSGSESYARADEARRAAEDSQRVQQTQQAQQTQQQTQQTEQDTALKGADQAAATNAVVAGAAHDNDTRGAPGAELIGAGATAPSTPSLPAATGDPSSLYAASPTAAAAPTAPSTPTASTENPARPAGQAPTSPDLNTALRQTARAGDAGREVAKQAGIDPKQVNVTGNEWRTIDKRTTEIELQRGEHAQGRAPEPKTWDGKAIDPAANAADVAKNDVMSQRFGGQENWDKAQQAFKDAPQAQRDAAAPANDPGKNDRARAMQYAGARGPSMRAPAVAPRAPAPTTAPTAPAATAPPTATTGPVSGARPLSTPTPTPAQPAPGQAPPSPTTPKPAEVAKPATPPPPPTTPKAAEAAKPADAPAAPTTPKPAEVAKPADAPPSPTTPKPAEAVQPRGSLTPDRVSPADAAKVADRTGVPPERVNRIANDLHAELNKTGGTPIAGVPGKQPVNDSARLAAQHGGDPKDWVKVSTSAREYQSNGQVRTATGQTDRPATGNGPSTVDTIPAGRDVVPKFEVHAYRNTQTGQIVEPKLVPYGPTGGRTNYDPSLAR